MRIELWLLYKNSNADKCQEGVCSVGCEFWFARLMEPNASAASNIPEFFLSHLGGVCCLSGGWVGVGGEVSLGEFGSPNTFSTGSLITLVER